MSFDVFLFKILNGLVGKSVFADLIFIFFSEYFGYFLILSLSLFLLKDFKKYRLIVASALLSAFAARFLITEIIRFFWERQRPFVENNVTLLFNHSPSGSFPSGHASFFFGLSAAVYFHNKKTGVLFFFASFLISISRVISGVHWPSDVLAGAAVGIFSGWLVFTASKKIFSNKCAPFLK